MSTADQIQQTQEQLNWHWRNSMRPVRCFNLDARAILPFCALIFYFRLITIFIAVFFTLIFWVVEKLGLTFPSALRKLRSVLVGQKRRALRGTRIRTFAEYK